MEEPVIMSENEIEDARGNVIYQNFWNLFSRLIVDALSWKSSFDKDYYKQKVRPVQ